jgi:hypothetical protein
MYVCKFVCSVKILQLNLEADIFNCAIDPVVDFYDIHGRSTIKYVR